MGEVYRAHDEKLVRDVALKVLPVGMLADEAARKRFRKEAVALAKLNHPNIETIYEFATQDGVDFLAMELIAGLTLGQKMNAGLLPNQETLKLGAQIAEGLNAAHERGVVHCDLKPGNVMVTSNGRAKVLDFGLARFFHASKNSLSTESLTEIQAAGTLPYMSPEQVRGERVDSRTDIYSAGAVLYEMGTGQKPFPETQAPRLIDAILHQLPLPPSTLNRKMKPEFENVILKALDKDPERRYQSATELSVDLKRLVASEPLISPRPYRSKRRILLWVAVAISLAAVLEVAFFGWRKTITFGHSESVTEPVPHLGSGKRLAVLPLTPVGNDQASFAYIANGFAEGLSEKLFMVNGLYICSADETAKVNISSPFPNLAESLGANFISHGTLEVSGDKVRVVLMLEDLAHGKRMWTQEFSGAKYKLQDLEDEAFEAIAAALGIKASEDELSRSETRETTNARAYDLYMQGRNSLRGHDVKSIQAALDEFERALHEDPVFVLSYAGTADAYLRMYDLTKDKIWIQKAIRASQEAQQLDDGLPEVHFVLGKAYDADGKFTEAIAEFQRAISLAPTSDEAYRQLGEAYLHSGDSAHAIEAFQKALQINPYYWVNHNALGDAYFQLGEYAKASQSFKQVTALAPDIDAGYENIGNVFAQRGMYQESIPFFQKAVQIEPYYTTYSNLGTAYFFMKQYGEAVQMFEKAVGLHPNDTMMMTNLGDAYRVEGEHDKARATYQQAVSLGYKELQTNPQDADVMSQMALCYANLGDSQQADAFIKKARAIDKKNINYIYNQAEIYALLGNKKEALNALQEALEKHYPSEFTAADPDLDSLRSSSVFNELIKKYSAKKPTQPASPVK